MILVTTISTRATLSKIFFLTGALLTLSLSHLSAGDVGKAVAIPAEQDTTADSEYVLFGVARPFIDGRFRFEFGDQQFREDSYSLTLRNRVGIETARWFGLSALAELEHTLSLLDADLVTRFPGPGRTVIADPENTELNRLQLDFHNEIWDTWITAGRQRIILDDSRFIGNVGWRQNEQTFDALRLQTSPLADLTLQYAWLTRVIRIFGEHAPSAALNHFNSDSHLINMRYAGLPAGNLTGFAYLLDLENAAAVSSQTYGARFDGSTEIAPSLLLIYDLTWGVQSDYAQNPNRFTAYYHRSEVGIVGDSGRSAGVGYEVLGEDHGNAFQAPLGTNHKYNGYADAFLITPDSGLRDFYVWIGAPLPGDINSRLSWHQFQTDTDGSSLGNEFDFTLGRQLTKNIATLGKVAWLDGDGSQVDQLRASFEISYSF